MFADMDAEARVYLVLLLVFVVISVGLMIALARALVRLDGARASERAARKAAITASAERDAANRVLGNIWRGQVQPELTVTRRDSVLPPLMWDRAARPNPLDAAGVASPTVAVPLVGRSPRHSEAT